MKGRRSRKGVTSHEYAVIMAGGGGTRLWPVSRQKKPKQFHSILGERSLLQKMYALLRKNFDTEHIFIQIPATFMPFIKEQIPEIRPTQILIEPDARDTGPAFAFAAESLRARDPEALVGFYYSDHLVQSERAFHSAVQKGFRAAEKFPNHLILIGVRPLYPHTGLGYIEIGKPVVGNGGSMMHEVRSFIEKPDLRRAKRFSASERHLWNTGYKIAHAAHIVELLADSHDAYEKHLPALARAINADDPKRIRSAFGALPRRSFEYVATEKARDMLVIASDMVWSDIGDWDAIDEVLMGTGSGTVRMIGSVAEHGSKNTLLVSNHRPIVGVGLTDIIVIETRDGVLVMAKNRSGEMKQALEKLRARHPKSL